MVQPYLIIEISQNWLYVKLSFRYRYFFKTLLILIRLDNISVKVDALKHRNQRSLLQDIYYFVSNTDFM